MDFQNFHHTEGDTCNSTDVAQSIDGHTHTHKRCLQHSHPSYFGNTTLPSAFKMCSLWSLQLLRVWIKFSVCYIKIFKLVVAENRNTIPVISEYLLTFCCKKVRRKKSQFIQACMHFVSSRTSSLHHLGGILFTSESYMRTDELAPTRSPAPRTAVYSQSPSRDKAMVVNVLSCS